MPSRSREINTPMLLGCASPYIIGQARIPSARPKSTIPPPTSLSPSHLPGVPEQRLTAPHACVGRRPQSPVHARLPLSPPPFLVTAAAGPSPPFPLRRPAPAPAPDQSGPRGRPHLPPRVHSLAVACPAGWPLGPRQLRFRMGLSSAATGDGVQLCVFDLQRGQQEGQELDKILYFYPADCPILLQLSVIGLCEGIVTFTRLPSLSLIFIVQLVAI